MPKIFDYIVIGGGPAAAYEANKLSCAGVNACIVSDSWGGCMEMLGDQLLQSYLNELQLTNSSFNLENYISSPRYNPTGCEYTHYIRDVFLSVPLPQYSGYVTYLEYKNDHFICHVLAKTSKFTLYSKQVILATGIRSRPMQKNFIPLNCYVNCFTAYREIYQRKFIRYQNRDVLIIGSGNTAFQLANILSLKAKSVTILAKNYLGLFPQETSNRFALRNLSQYTIERIAKLNSQKISTAFNGNCTPTPIRFFVYKNIYIDASKRHLTFEIDKKYNTCHIALHSFEYSYESHLLNRMDANGQHWQQSFLLKNLVVISAIGVEAQIPNTMWPQLIDKKTGFVKHTRGRTQISGLYVAGSCAGYPSVNTMQSPHIRSKTSLLSKEAL